MRNYQPVQFTRRGLKTFMMGLLSVLLTCLASSAAVAQEGHPVNGTWRGEFIRGTDTSAATAIVIIMNYNGDSITGLINPGRNSFPIKSAQLDAAHWSLAVTAENRQGETIAFTGTMSDIGSRSRHLDGTWTQDGQAFPFRITRE